MKKITKLLSVLLAIAVIICPMMSAVVVNAEGAGNGYSLKKVNETTLQLTIDSTDGFLVYQATVELEEADNTVSEFSVAGYTLKGGAEPIYGTTNPIVTPHQDGKNVTFIVASASATCLDLYTQVKINFTVKSGTTATLTKIQAADNGDGQDVSSDPTLLDFSDAGVSADGTVNEDSDYAKEHATPHVHVWQRKSNGNGTHTVTCTGCDYNEIEDCDKAGTDGACSKCGYKAATEPVLDPTLANSIVQKNVNISDRFGVQFMMSLNGRDIDDFEFVISKKNLSTTTFNYDGKTTEKTYTSSTTGVTWYSSVKSAMFVYSDVDLYEIGSDITFTIYTKKSGVRTSYYTFDATSLYEIADAYYTKSTAQSTRDILADMLRLAEASRVFFGSRGEAENLLTSLPSFTTNVVDTDGADDYGTLSEVVGTKDSEFTNVAINIGATPGLEYSFMKNKSSFKELANVTFTVSYDSLFTGKTETTVIYASELDSKYTQYASAVGGYTIPVYFIPLYDADKTITVVASDGVDSYTHQYSILSKLSTVVNDSTLAGDIYRALAYFNASARAFFPNY